jgi:hypothetical protein
LTQLLSLFALRFSAQFQPPKGFDSLLFVLCLDSLEMHRTIPPRQQASLHKKNWFDDAQAEEKAIAMQKY